MADALTTSPVPAGFRESGSGLVVPEAVSREREVWLYDGEELKKFHAAQKMAIKRGLRMPLICYHPRCIENENGFTILRRVEISGGYELQCEHKTRVCMSSQPNAPRQG